MLTRLPRPVRYAGEPATAFERGPTERPLRIVIDVASLPHNEARDHLLGFAYLADLEVTPHPAVGGVGTEMGDIDVARDMRLYVRRGNDNADLRGIWPYSQRQERASDLAATTGLANAVAIASVEAQVAEELRADMYVSYRECWRPGVAPTPWSSPVSAEDALAILGLFLRSRDNFTIRREERATYTSGTAAFLWSITHSLLPSLHEWLTSCVRHADESGSPELRSYGAAAARRFQHALLARDELLVRSYRQQTTDTATETMFSFATVSVMLAGVFDAVARVVHHTFALEGSIRNAGWQRKTWRKSLQSVALGFDAALDADALRVVDLLMELRNNIHGAEFAPMLLSSTHLTELQLQIPPASAPHVADLIAAMGDPSDWGLHPRQGELWFEPDTLIEQLLPRTIELIDRLMSTCALRTQWNLGTLPGRQRSPEESLLDRCARRLLGI